MNSGKVTVTFEPGGHQLVVPPGITILEAARLAGLRQTAPCGGAGKCGKCLVNIISHQQENQQGWCLACQTEINQDLTVYVPGEELIILEEGQAYPITLEPTMLLGEKLDNEAKKPLGLAVDLGTTTIVGYLYDLSSGKSLAVASGVNEQLTYGADVISRLSYALKGSQQYQQLGQAVLQSVDKIICRCCQQAEVNPSSIREVVMVGNTPMIHLILNLPVQGLATSPFKPYEKGPFYITAPELGLHTVSQAVCYFPPFIGGFVGSDALAAALSQGFGSDKPPKLLVDIGTNGEILLQVGKKLLAASAPAGPALEGGNITCGMMAERGAICKVLVDYDVRLETIGGSEPRGICGSGLVDTVAEMLRLGITDSSGRIINSAELPPITSFRIKQRVMKGDNDSRFMLADNVYINQKDIREVQLAKSAVAAGIEVVMQEAGLKDCELDQLLLAGGFGNYLNPSNAQRIGLLGDCNLSKIKQVGNAAGSGAVMILLSYSARKRAEDLSNRFIHLELANDQRYQDAFIKQLNFPSKECGV